MDIQHTEQEHMLFKQELKNSLKEFYALTETEDYMGVILRAHIYIEKDLSRLIELLLLRPEKIKLPYFSSKLDAAYAMGAIDENWYSPLNKLNKIRNKYAHDFGYEFTNKEYDDLVSTLSKEARDEFMNNLEDYEFIQQIINSTTLSETEFDLKKKLQILISEMMIYVKQLSQTIEVTAEDIYLGQKIKYLDLKIERLAQIKE